MAAALVLRALISERRESSLEVNFVKVVLLIVVMDL